MLASPENEVMVREFVDAHNLEPLTLLDNERIYGSYDRTAIGETYAPYPLHVVLDGSHTIRHLSVESDPDAIVVVLEELLAEL